MSARPAGPTARPPNERPTRTTAPRSRLRRLALWAVVVAGLAGPLPHAAAQRRSSLTSSDPGYFASPTEPAAGGFTARDEAWYDRNRRIALAGKLLTVLGLATTFALGVPREANGIVVAGVATQLTGQLVWTAADLRGANELRRLGHRVTKLPGIVAVCGALLLAPVAWIAGPVQSARIRQAHDATLRPLPRSQPARGQYGLTALVAF